MRVKFLIDEISKTTRLTLFFKMVPLSQTKKQSTYHFCLYIRLHFFNGEIQCLKIFLILPLHSVVCRLFYTKSSLSSGVCPKMKKRRKTGGFLGVQSSATIQFFMGSFSFLLSILCLLFIFFSLSFTVTFSRSSIYHDWVIAKV